VRRSGDAEETEEEEKDPVRVVEKSLVPEYAVNFQGSLGALRQKGCANVGHIFLTRAHDVG
jgi:hypothetical protein